MSDLRKAAEELIPILDRWKMTYPPCSGADWDKVESLRQALAQPKHEPVAWRNKVFVGDTKYIWNYTESKVQDQNGNDLVEYQELYL